MVERKVTLGADPEVILYKKFEWEMSRLETPYPVCGLFGGTKGAPTLIHGDLGGWLEDGTMLELNPNPTSSAIQLSVRVDKLFAAAKKHAAVHNLIPLTGRDCAAYDMEELKKHKEAFTFGCALDLNAYSQGTERESPMRTAMTLLGEGVRFAGGHLHLGVDPWPEALPKFVAIRLMDLLLGLPLMFSYGSGARRDYYGLPGLYRETSYGVEYRTPNNFWMQECRNGSFTLGRLKSIGLMFAAFEELQDDLVQLYNTVNWDQFEKIYRTHNAEAVLDCVDMLIAGPRESIRVGERLYSLSSCAAMYALGANRDDVTLGDSREPQGLGDLMPDENFLAPVFAPAYDLADPPPPINEPINLVEAAVMAAEPRRFWVRRAGAAVEVIEEPADEHEPYQDEWGELPEDLNDEEEPDEDVA